MLQVYLGEQYVNNSTLSDVTFLVEGSKYVIAFKHSLFSFITLNSLCFPFTRETVLCSQNLSTCFF